MEGGVEARRRHLTQTRLRDLVGCGVHVYANKMAHFLMGKGVRKLSGTVKGLLALLAVTSLGQHLALFGCL